MTCKVYLKIEIGTTFKNVSCIYVLKKYTLKISGLIQLVVTEIIIIIIIIIITVEKSD